jgi:hypothetical protein
MTPETAVYKYASLIQVQFVALRMYYYSTFLSTGALKTTVEYIIHIRVIRIWKHFSSESSLLMFPTKKRYLPGTYYPSGSKTLSRCCMGNSGRRLWAGSRNGTISAFDISQKPWLATNSWKAHPGFPVVKLMVNHCAITKAGKLWWLALEVRIS